MEIETVKAREKKSNRTGVIVILILFILLIALAAWLVSDYSPINSSYRRTADLLALPRVSTSLQSSDDGEKHSLEANFTLELKLGEAKFSDKTAIGAAISEIVSKIDYDRLMESDGGDFLKAALTEGLAGFYPDGELLNIYLTQFAGDYHLPIELPDSKRNSIFDAIFGK